MQVSLINHPFSWLLRDVIACTQLFANVSHVSSYYVLTYKIKSSLTIPAQRGPCHPCCFRFAFSSTSHWKTGFGWYCHEIKTICGRFIWKILLAWHVLNILYARHYNPRFVYFLPTFWSPRGFFLKILALCMVSI